MYTIFVAYCAHVRKDKNSFCSNLEDEHGTRVEERAAVSISGGNSNDDRVQSLLGISLSANVCAVRRTRVKFVVVSFMNNIFVDH